MSSDQIVFCIFLKAVLITSLKRHRIKAKSFQPASAEVSLSSSGMKGEGDGRVCHAQHKPQLTLGVHKRVAGLHIARVDEQSLVLLACSPVKTRSM